MDYRTVYVAVILSFIAFFPPRLASQDIRNTNRTRETSARKVKGAWHKGARPAAQLSHCVPVDSSRATEINETETRVSEAKAAEQFMQLKAQVNIGAHSALPIWTQFMKRTTDYPAYDTPQQFAKPDGIVTVALDNTTNLVAPAGSDSAMTHSEAFIEGSEPFPPQDVIDVAQTPDGAPPEGDDSSQKEDDIVLVNEAPGRKVYVNTGAPISRPPSHSLSPLDSTLPANLTSQDEAGAVTAAPSNVNLLENGAPDHK